MTMKPEVKKALNKWANKQGNNSGENWDYVSLYGINKEDSEDLAQFIQDETKKEIVGIIKKLMKETAVDERIWILNVVLHKIESKK